MQLWEAEILGCPTNDASLGLRKPGSNGMVIAIQLQHCYQINDGNAGSLNKDDSGLAESLSEAGWAPAVYCLLTVTKLELVTIDI